MGRNRVLFPFGTTHSDPIKSITYTDEKSKDNLEIPALKHLPEQIANPVAILKSNTQKDKGRVILTEWNDKNNEDIHQILSNRLQLPEANTEDISNNNLSQSEKIVNNNSMQNSDNNSSNSKNF